MGLSKSCIDLIFTDQPNLFLETGVHPSVHEQCHHQIVYGKLAVKNLAPPPIIVESGSMIELTNSLLEKVSTCFNGVKLLKS